MERHFCDNEKCGREILYGGMKPQSKLRIVVEFIRSENNERPLDMGYGREIKENSLGKVEFCCTKCAEEWLAERRRKINAANSMNRN